MLIDWFTVAAQLINFLILVYLLRRFLYGPIQRVIQQREAAIAAQMQEAITLQAMSSAAAADYAQQRAELDSQRTALLEQARADAETWRKEYSAQARREIEEARAGWYKSVQVEQDAFLRTLRQRLATQVCAISRQTLADLADADLEQRVLQVFIRRLRTLDEDQQAFLATMSGDHAPLHVRSSFPLTNEARADLQQALHHALGSHVEAHYSQDPALLCGIEISNHDHKLAWTLEDYLTGLESSLADLLETRAASSTPEARHVA
jgi:F-type H+-transporting ATPase subunit b